MFVLAHLAKAYCLKKFRIDLLNLYRFMNKI